MCGLMGGPDPVQEYSIAQLPYERTGRPWMAPDPDLEPMSLTALLWLLVVIGCIIWVVALGGLQ